MGRGVGGKGGGAEEEEKTTRFSPITAPCGMLWAHCVADAPGLAAVVAAAADDDARLFNRLPPHAVLYALAVLHKAGERAPAVGRPARLPAKERAVRRGVNDKHNGDGVAPGEPRCAAAARILGTRQLNAALGHAGGLAAAATVAVAADKLEGGARLRQCRRLPRRRQRSAHERQGKAAHVALVQCELGHCMEAKRWWWQGRVRSGGGWGASRKDSCDEEHPDGAGCGGLQRTVAAVGQGVDIHGGEPVPARNAVLRLSHCEAKGSVLMSV